MSPRHIRRPRPARADARLVEMVNKFKRLRRRLDALAVREDCCADWAADGPAIRAEENAIVEECCRIRAALVELPARTPAGIAAKAWLAEWEFADPEDHPDVAVAWSLARDVRRAAA